MRRARHNDARNAGHIDTIPDREDGSKPEYALPSFKSAYRPGAGFRSADERYLAGVRREIPLARRLWLFCVNSMVSPELQILSRHPDTCLLVIGDTGFWEDDYKQELHTLAEELGCAHAVRWLGFREDVQQLLALTDIVVLPSDTEPFGMVLIEAMAAGKPVIATRAAGPMEIVNDGETGLLVPIGDAGALAEAACTLLADSTRAGQMGRAGRARAEEMFDISRLVEQLYGVYDSLSAG